MIGWYIASIPVWLLFLWFLWNGIVTLGLVYQHVQRLRHSEGSHGKVQLMTISNKQFQELRIAVLVNLAAAMVVGYIAARFVDS